MIWLCPLQHSGSFNTAGGLSCSKTCGVFSNQGLNPIPYIARQILNHWTSREVPSSSSFFFNGIDLLVSLGPLSCKIFTFCCEKYSLSVVNLLLFLSLPLILYQVQLVQGWIRSHEAVWRCCLLGPCSSLCIASEPGPQDTWFLHPNRDSHDPPPLFSQQLQHFTL